MLIYSLLLNKVVNVSEAVVTLAIIVAIPTPSTVQSNKDISNTVNTTFIIPPKIEKCIGFLVLPIARRTEYEKLESISVGMLQQ